MPPPSSLDRKGYYAVRNSATYTPLTKTPVEDALMLEDPSTDLSIAMEIDHCSSTALNIWAYHCQIPGRGARDGKRGGAEHTLITSSGDKQKKINKDCVGGHHRFQCGANNVNIKLTDATAGELARRPIEYDKGSLPDRASYMDQVWRAMTRRAGR